MAPSPYFTGREQDALLRVMQSSLHVQSHFQLLLWLQGEFQELIQHDILLSISGNFADGDLHYDIVSAMPGVRTENLVQCSIHELRTGIHQRWIESGGRATVMASQNGFAADRVDCVLNDAFRQMRHAIFHAIPDARFKADHLYIFLRRDGSFDDHERQRFGLLLPHLDAAVRKIEGLPEMHPAQVDSQRILNDLLKVGLTPREIEILEWVRGGKTNIEIGMILGISAFTVKNHLQRIFKKINVTNRAQAVGALERLAQGELEMQRASAPLAA